MAMPMHVYRMSDLMEQIHRSIEPFLIFACRGRCRRDDGRRHCAHRDHFAPMADLPVPVVAIDHEDLQQIPLRGYEASWGHALLVYQGHVVHQWPQIPSRVQLEAALDTLAVSLQDPQR